MEGERKAEKTSGSTSKTESAVRGAKPSAAVPAGGAPAYAGAEGVPMTQPIPVPAPMMPYYGQYAAMYAMPPGAAPMGFPVQQPPAPGAAPMWMPGMVPAPPQGGSPGQSMTGQPYPAPYGTGAHPLMYMPVPYNYPPYIPAPSPAAMGAAFNGQPAKAPAQGAAPPYGASAGAAATAGAAAAATPSHPHSASAEPAMISPPSMPSPASPSTTTVTGSTAAGAAAVAAGASAAAPAVPAVTPIEYVVMPLMPNTRLPPGDPFCPAGVTVSPQYAVSSLPTRTSAVPDRALTNGIHKPASPAPSAPKAEPASPSATTSTTTAAVAAAPA